VKNLGEEKRHQTISAAISASKALAAIGWRNDGQRKIGARLARRQSVSAAIETNGSLGKEAYQRHRRRGGGMAAAWRRWRNGNSSAANRQTKNKTIIS
jgi:hypothetical protein